MMQTIALFLLLFQLKPAPFLMQAVATGNHRKIFSGGGGGGCTTYTDAFPGSSLGASWTTLSGSFSVSSGALTGSSSGDNYAYRNTGTFGADQCSCMTAVSAASSNGVGVSVRFQNISGPTGYRALWLGGQVTLAQVFSGGYNPITGGGPFSYTDGHVLCLIAQGSTISVIDTTASTTIVSLTDTVIHSGGAPGVIAFNTGTATGANWHGGNYP